MGIHIDSSEVRKLGIDLGRAGGRVGAKVSAAVRKTAFDIESDGKILAPVDTGFLMGSISTDITGDGRFGTIQADIGPTAHYGHYVEDGTSRMAPQPYMGPAFERRAPGLEQAIGNAAEDVL